MNKTEKRRPAQRLPKQIGIAVAAAEAKQATDILVLDMRKSGGFTDYFVICSGGSARQIRAIADAIIDALAVGSVRPAHLEGYQRSEWVLVDYFDFVVHIFSPDARLFYSLERLWGNAERIEP